MWEISLPHWWEFVLRAVVIYFFLLVLLRLTGKRQVGQLAPFDFVLLLVLSNAVQNSMNGGDNSVTGGMILATTLVVTNSFVGWLAYRSKNVGALVEGRPVILVHNGKVDHDSLQQVHMTTHALEAALRQDGHGGPATVRFAVLENTGKISVISMQSPDDNSEKQK